MSEDSCLVLFTNVDIASKSILLSYIEKVLKSHPNNDLCFSSYIRAAFEKHLVCHITAHEEIEICKQDELIMKQFHN